MTKDIEQRALMEPFCQSAKEALKVMANFDIEYGEIKDFTPWTEGQYISTYIQLEGSLKGNLILYFNEQAACLITEALLGIECTQADESVLDSINEFLNLVAGQTKTKMDGTKNEFLISTPLSLSRKDLEAFCEQSIWGCSVPLILKQGEIYMALLVEKASL